MKKLAQIKKILFALTLLGYVLITVFGFIHVAHMAEMNMPMEHCPFAIGEHTLCQMSVTEHIRAWEQFSARFIPTLGVLLFTPVFLFFFLDKKYSPFLSRPLFYLKRQRLRNYSLYQELFSLGILNPKAP